jgi:hypothetical protein
MCLRIDTKVFFVELFVTQGIVFESITEFAVQLNVYIYIYNYYTDAISLLGHGVNTCPRLATISN